MTKEKESNKTLNLTGTEGKYMIIGAGPSGVSAAKNLKTHNIPFDGFEAAADVGGLWNINNSNSTVYNSAHLISSKGMTQFDDFPMSAEVAEYPNHIEMCNYIQSYAKEYKLYDHYHFNIKVEQLIPKDDAWEVTLSTGEKYIYKGVIIANGILSKPNIPQFKGDFTGEIIHSADYKVPDVFDNKRVLMVGAGNSGCDIAVDAVHSKAKKVDMSVRRGYYFVPKYVMGQPADTVGKKIRLPAFLKQKVDTLLIKLIIGSPEKYGFPKPDHKLYESHPIINSLVLHYLGHGDLDVKGDIDRFEGKTVYFKDGSHEEYDLILLATGYNLDYPFIDRKELDWNDTLTPDFYINIFHRRYNNLFISGMFEATGLGFQGRSDAGELIAKFINANEKQTDHAKKFIAKKKTERPDLSGGYKYLKIDRMSYYVHKWTYKKLLLKQIAFLSK